jgi:2,4-diaminopentanoate dehydrogenase
MPNKIKFAHMGMGPMGAIVCRLACEKRGIEIIGALEKVGLGKDVGEVLNLGKQLHVYLTDSLSDILAKKPDVLIHTTVSSAIKAKDQLVPFITAGVNIVSTCEELSYPWNTQPEISKELDELAKANNVSILATGVNPGFCMDTFPIVMTGVCRSVEHVRAVRIQDARSRRLPFQKKIGAGCTPAEFVQLKQAGTLRHVGLEESTGMIAAAMGWIIDDYSESIDPVMMEEPISSELLPVKPGQVSGVEQIAVAWMKGREIIKMEFRAYLGAPESYDAVYITGEPNLEVIVKGGIQGDIATASMVVNAIPGVIKAPPGLLSMKDMPLVHSFAGDWSRLI